MADDAPRLLGIGSIFIDDIIMANGNEHLETLGGGVTHALMAAPLFGERPDICAVIGEDLSDGVREHLAKWINPRGLIELPHPQMRIWQIFDEQGHRREIARVAITEPFFRGALPAHLPIELASSEAVYLLQGPEGMREWSKVLDDCLIVWEPLQQVMVSEMASEVRSVISDSGIHGVSPNLREAQAVWGDLMPNELTQAMLNDGAEVAALRLGADGSLVQWRGHEAVAIPAIPVDVLDQTGAGNTYCGALTLGLMRGLRPDEAACMGAVAAASSLTQIGTIDPELVDPVAVRARMAWISQHLGT